MKNRYVNRENGKTYVYLIRHAHWEPPKGPHKFNPHHPLRDRYKINCQFQPIV